MVTVVATGFSSEQQHEIIDAEPKKIVHSLDDNTQFVKELDTTSSFTDISFENSLKKKEKVVYQFDDTPQAPAEEASTKSNMGITLHTTSEKKAKSINIDDSLYQLPVHFEVVERVVPIQQENFVIYQEKKTTATKATPQRQQAEERKVV